MTRHYLDPRDAEPCPECAKRTQCRLPGCANVPTRNDAYCSDKHAKSRFGTRRGQKKILCPTCAGTGRRGGKRERVIEVQQHPTGSFYWRRAGESDWNPRIGGHDTEPNALLAARAAVLGVELRFDRSVDSYPWMLLGAPDVMQRSYATPEAALIAVIDAKREVRR